MTEYISNTHDPGSDGIVLPAVVVPGQTQGYLYRWCRILAGGLPSQFSSIIMRGPLTLVDGTAVVSTARFTESFSAGTSVYTFVGAPLTVNDTTAAPTDLVVRTSGGKFAAAAGTSLVVTNVSGVTLTNVLVTISIELEGNEVVPGVNTALSLTADVGGTPVAGFERKLTTNSSNGNYQTIGGQFVIQSWNDTANLQFFLVSAANSVFVGGAGSLDIQLLA